MALRKLLHHNVITRGVSCSVFCRQQGTVAGILFWGVKRNVVQCYNKRN